MAKSQRGPSFSEITARVAAERSVTTPAAVVSGDESDHLPPLFSFKFIDRTGSEPDKFGWDLTPSCREHILDFMRDISTSKWHHINQMLTKTQHKRHHAQPLDDIVQSAQDRIVKLEYEPFIEGDKLFRFRIGHKGRLWGFKTGQVFNVLWWDPEHNVCPD